MNISTRIFHPNWRTILYVVKNGRVLLAMKKRGFGAGYYNGMGGKPEPGESPLDTAIRETREEVGIIPVNLYHAANVRFRSQFVPALNDLYAYVFAADNFKGKPAETEEMAPRWFKFAEIPYDKMWDDDRHWLPKVLAGKFVCAEFHFDKQNKVINSKVVLFTPRPRAKKSNLCH